RPSRWRYGNPNLGRRQASALPLRGDRLAGETPEQHRLSGTEDFAAHGLCRPRPPVLIPEPAVRLRCAALHLWVHGLAVALDLGGLARSAGIRLERHAADR